MLDASLGEGLRNAWYALTGYLGSRPTSWYILTLVVVLILAWLISRK